ncbi:MAG: Gfo/Idh/MocA family oxidoreductase [Verrucomicrobia bacterium]|nr:Gfo/Idh/MocA family oxidoreductase [Verrucomicrobiota bacterium]
MNASRRASRRSFLQHLSVAGLTAPMIARDLIAAPPSRRLIHASFGGSGMAGADLETLLHHDFVKLAAVADVDLAHAARWKAQFPSVRIYQDWRELLDREKDLDTVNVSTPDHMHAPIAMAALQLGRHAYVQKPLTHDVYETRRLTEVAREKKRATQMGIQIHSGREYRSAVRLVQDGAVGKIREVHTWSNKKWGDMGPLPDRTDDVPKTLNWDLWLGVCAARPFIGSGYYHPGNWRKRLDFGTGTFGDMGCHIYDPVFKALGLTAPLSIRSEGPAPNAWNWATNAIIHYVFPGTQFTESKTVPVTWYDGDARPPKDVQALLGDARLPGQGSILIGSRGTMLIPHIAMPQLLPRDQFHDYPMPNVETPHHYTQFLEAARDNGKPPLANFDYAGPLTEAVLLGSVATRFPKTTLEWNAKKLKFTNVPEANAFIRRTYRPGWESKGLS